MWYLIEGRKNIAEAKAKIAKLERSIKINTTKMAKINAKYKDCKSFTEACENMKQSLVYKNRIDAGHREIFDLKCYIEAEDTKMCRLANSPENYPTPSGLY